MRRIIMGLVTCAICTTATAQVNTIKPLQVNDRVPESVMKKLAGNSKAPLLILDFWASFCTNCIEAFSHINSLQTTFSNDLRVVLIDSWEDSATMAMRLSKSLLAKKGNIRIPKLPAIYNDSILSSYFPATSIPHHVWIYKGKVIAITFAHNATKDHVARVLKGVIPFFAVKDDARFLDYQPLKQAMVTVSHSGLQPACLSGIFRYHSGLNGGITTKRDSAAQTARAVFINTPVTVLYQYAYDPQGGRIRTLIETPDSNNYVYPDWLEEGDQMDQWNESNRYSYEITVPLEKEATIPSIMQADLNRFFRSEKQLEGTTEERITTCFILIVSDSALLPKTKSNKSSVTTDSTQITYISGSMMSISSFIGSRFEDQKNRHYFINETNLGFARFDMSIPMQLRELKAFNNYLSRYGLHINVEERKVKILVLKQALIN